MRRHTQYLRFAAVMLALTTCFATTAAWAGTYTRLQVLLPGESAAPGTSTGKTGTPGAQTAGVPFSITVRACDASWNTVTSVTDAIQILCSDASATLPSPSQLVSGQQAVMVTLNAGGNFTLYAHDQTDNTIPDGTSSLVTSLVLQGFQFSRVTQKNQYAGTPMTLSVTAVDPGGSTVSGFSGSVKLKEITSFGEGRISPESVTMSSGSWTGAVTMYRADETSINRGNVNLYAYLESDPSKNGTSDPFTVHPGLFHRIQIVLPGEAALAGSVSGLTGTPTAQTAGRAFNVIANATDDYWNLVPSGDVVRVTSSDPGFTPASGTLVSPGTATLSATLVTVGSQTLTVNDQTNGSITGMTSALISVLPASADHFAFAVIPSPLVAGVPAPVAIRAVDASGNTVPNYSGAAVLIANTGAGTITPELVSFTNGLWSGSMVFRGAGNTVSVNAADFSSPPHTGTSNSFVVSPGTFSGLQVLLPGESVLGGTAAGKSGSPLGQRAGIPFNLTVRAVDQFWNLVNSITDRVALGSSDAFALMPAETTLVGGQLTFPISLARSGAQRIWASDLDQPSIQPDTSSAVQITGGTFAKLVLLAPGEYSAPGTAEGRAGTATAQSINYAFTVTVLATDAWFNPVAGISDAVHLSSNDIGAQLQADTTLTDGRATMTVRLATGGFQQITASDVTSPSKSASTTQVNAISTGFHLEATVAPATARAGEPFTLSVKVTNDAGSVIQEINSFVTVTVQNATTRQLGKGTLLTSEFQLLQGQRAISETYSFPEPIVMVVRDDAGNAPGVTGTITITPGSPVAVHLSSSPTWVPANKHATLSAKLVDEFDNGVPGVATSFALLSGNGILTAIDAVTDDGGVARADFLSPRQPEHDVIRATAAGFSADLDLETAFVNPDAPGGTVTNYPNPFHPGTGATTVAYKLSDQARVTIRIFTQSGDLVREVTMTKGATGGIAGLNTWQWDGRNGQGDVVASGGYVLLIEAQGTGQTVNVMRRKVGVVR